jgi:hypothetical protein
MQDSCILIASQSDADIHELLFPTFARGGPRATELHHISSRGGSLPLDLRGPDTRREPFRQPTSEFGCYLHDTITSIQKMVYRMTLLSRLIWRLRLATYLVED